MKLIPFDYINTLMVTHTDDSIDLLQVHIDWLDKDVTWTNEGGYEKFALDLITKVENEANLDDWKTITYRAYDCDYREKEFYCHKVYVVKTEHGNATEYEKILL